jgi:predicted amidohydrolase
MNVRLCAVNAPVMTQGLSADEVTARAVSFARSAASQGAQFIVLPEYLDALGREPAEMRRHTHAPGDALFAQMAEIAARHKCWIVAPVLHREGRQIFNSAFLIGHDGQVMGRYDKTHLSAAEKQMGLSAGDQLPVFRTAQGAVAVMTCFDAYFPEVARTLALRGAQVIAFPTTQRSETEEFVLLQARMRAFDACAFVVRASYGVPLGQAWRPGMPVGMACIIAPDATVLACTGRTEGVAIADADLSHRFPRPASHGMAPEPQRQVLLASRRPGLYSALVQQE